MPALFEIIGNELYFGEGTVWTQYWFHSTRTVLDFGDDVVSLLIQEVLDVVDIAREGKSRAQRANHYSQRKLISDLAVVLIQYGFDLMQVRFNQEGLSLLCLEFNLPSELRRELPHLRVEANAVHHSEYRNQNGKEEEDKPEAPAVLGVQCSQQKRDVGWDCKDNIRSQEQQP